MDFCKSTSEGLQTSPDHFCRAATTEGMRRVGRTSESMSWSSAPVSHLELMSRSGPARQLVVNFDAVSAVEYHKVCRCLAAWCVHHVHDGSHHDFPSWIILVLRGDPPCESLSHRYPAGYPWVAPDTHGVVIFLRGNGLKSVTHYQCLGLDSGSQGFPCFPWP